MESSAHIIETCRSGARPNGARLTSVESLRLRDGRALCVRRWRGPAPGTLVVLHGLLDSSEGWSGLCDRVNCSGIIFDLPGFGHSDPPSRGSIMGYARDVADGLKMLGVERFTLVGHSLGGAVATAVAEMMPAKVDALVLFAPAGFGRIHLAEAASVPGVRNLVQAALPWALSSRLAVTACYLTMVTNGRSPARGVIERVTSRGRALVDGTREGIRAVADAGRSRDAFHRRRVGYSGPVVAVWGDRDRIVPTSHQDGLLTALPQARTQVWPGMGHHPIRERFDELVALIADRSASARPPLISAHRHAAGSPRLADAA